MTIPVVSFIILEIIIVLALAILFAFVNSILSPIMRNFYNESIKENLIIRKKQKILKKLNFINGLPDDEKEKYVGTLAKYSKILENLSNENTKENEEYKKLTLDDIELTERVKTIIDSMIETSTYSVLREYISLNKKYEILNLDKDVSKISKEVFSSLNSATLQSTYVFNNEYILSYIVNQSFNLLLKVVLDMNSNIIS